MIPNGATFGNKHTRRDFNMIPKSKIIFAPPAPKTIIYDVPSMDGELDFTDALTGEVYYNNRKGTLNFHVITNERYQEVYTSLLSYFNGKKMNVILDDDPDYFYRGRFAVNEWKSWEGRSTIAIDYNLEPFKYAVGGNTSTKDWQWHDWLDDTILYGTFNVNGSKYRNIINPMGIKTTPVITATAPMTVTYKGADYSIPSGASTMHGIILDVGDNLMKFTGNGTVNIGYETEESL